MNQPADDRASSSDSSTGALNVPAPAVVDGLVHPVPEGNDRLNAHVVPNQINSPAASVRRWGPWATLGWTLLCMLGGILAQLLAVIAIGVLLAIRARMDGERLPDPETLIQQLQNGDVLSFIIAANFAGMLAVFLPALLIRGSSITSYLALNRPAMRPLLCYSVALIGVLTIATIAAHFLDVHETFALEWYQSGGSRVAMLLLLVVAAPVCEEALFRGFMLPGLAASRIGPLGAILISTLAWASLHLQYGWFGLSYVIALGLLFGVARWKTGSTTIPMILHAATNLASFVLVALTATE